MLGLMLLGGGGQKLCENGAAGTAPWSAMKIVTWNCRGLDNRPAVRGLLDL
jgi:hypothetical protein